MIRTTTILLEGDFSDVGQIANDFRDVVASLAVRVDAIHHYDLLDGWSKMTALFPGGEVDLRLLDERHAVARVLTGKDHWSPHGKLQKAVAARWTIRSEEIEQVPLLRVFTPAREAA